MASTIRVAACHAAPIFLNAKATTQKAISLIKTASKNNANLVVFPETFIPAFPVWSALRPPTQNHALFQKMAAESIHADGEEIQAIRATAQETRTFVSVGISEKARYSCGTLFNANMIIGPDGQVLNHHRKLMPTFFEKLTWAHGDGYGLRTVDTPWGKVGNLICGENTNPLARYAMMAQAEQLHVSTWPAVWPTRVVEEGVEDKSEEGEAGGKESKNYDNVAANRTRAAAHCFEAKAFGVLCSGVLDDMAIDWIIKGAPNAQHLKNVLKSSQRGATMFLDPTGAAINGYTIDPSTNEKKETECLQQEEGILYADLDMSECVEGKQYHDVVGGYQRLDIFDLRINRSRQRPVSFEPIGSNHVEDE